jgi:hypothetical protein
MASTLEVAYFRVQGLSVPVLTLPDRRLPEHRRTRWCLLRDMEAVLYGNANSTGAIHRLLARESLCVPQPRHCPRSDWRAPTTTDPSPPSLRPTCSLPTTLSLQKSSVGSLVTLEEWAELLRVLTEQLSLEARGRVRRATQIPLPVCATLCRAFGRSPQAAAWLEAFSQPSPAVWQLQAEAEANASDGAVDYVLNEQLAELEEADVRLADELKGSFLAYQEPECDEEATRVYTLERVPPALEKALLDYERFRLEPLNRLRDGSAVVDSTVTADKSTALRFLGWLQRQHSVVPELKVFSATSLGARVESFVAFLRTERGCRFSTCANYINGLVSVAAYVLETSPSCEEGASLEPLLRMRAQAESAAKQDHLWKRKDPCFIQFEDAQRARAAAIEAHSAYAGTDHKKRLGLVRDCLILSFLTCQPPDRVGVLRKLRYGATLKRGEASGAWVLDLTERRGCHKTAKFYGPSVTTINPLIAVWLSAYLGLLAFDRPEEESTFYLFPVGNDFSRCVAGSQWTQMVKACFKRWSGVEVTPKTLRASFICWLKSETDAPEVLKSAATAMRHKEETQASSRYDVEVPPMA